EVEDLATALPTGELERAAMQVVPVPEGRAGAGGGLAVHDVDQPAKAQQALRLRRGLQFVGGLETGHGGMVVGRADEEGREPGAEVAAAADVGSAEYWVADATNQPDVIGDVAFGRSEARDNGSQVGRIRRGAGLAAQQVVHGVEMVTDVADVGHRADEADVLGQGSEARVQL